METTFLISYLWPSMILTMIGEFTTSWGIGLTSCLILKVKVNFKFLSCLLVNMIELYICCVNTRLLVMWGWIFLWENYTVSFKVQEHPKLGIWFFMKISKYQSPWKYHQYKYSWLSGKVRAMSRKHFWNMKDTSIWNIYSFLVKEYLWSFCCTLWGEA